MSADMPREPDCIHSNHSQPASACRICKDGPVLKAWREYWASVDPESANGQRKAAYLRSAR